jgi:hypothetical protein
MLDSSDDELANRLYMFAADPVRRSDSTASLVFQLIQSPCAHVPNKPVNKFHRITHMEEGRRCATPSQMRFRIGMLRFDPQTIQEFVRTKFAQYSVSVTWHLISFCILPQISHAA